MMVADLFGNVREDVLHEGGKLRRVIDPEERVQMVAHDYHCEDANTE
jgi:hypothetical protein